MVKAYEGKLSEFVIPVEELGFDPRNIHIPHKWDKY
jgi:hypothetical protein